MNLVCFPHNAAGGLLCSLLNDTDYDIIDGMYNKNIEHSIFKIGDSRGVHRQFDEAKWLQRIKMSVYKDKWPKWKQGYNTWFGTHCHPSVIPDTYIKMFVNVISITTETKLSRWYRFLRSYHNYLGKVIGNATGGFIDIRSCAFEMLDPFEQSPNTQNVEFETIVNGTFVEERKLNETIFNRWKEANSYLYKKPDETLLKTFEDAYALQKPTKITRSNVQRP